MNDLYHLFYLLIKANVSLDGVVETTDDGRVIANLPPRLVFENDRVVGYDS